ncbi:PREDICTED: uncharacterized protein At1g01500-like isoform X2 [Nelumbo nucifera]|uniref:Uncharacterized protein n=2 Tax=Nelumbo nucifera TaxID=4432 RepID=A0A822XGI2_NELNU|nr:PREDICTED: uncharacterized protein At1g01500-like isoform X2 [Nelumbo nucifera]DAD19032.1 TPA_asm: hypothetical protein HUJ06_020495 [Nelumbo nucifera]
MDFQEKGKDSSLAICVPKKNSNPNHSLNYSSSFYRLMNLPASPPSSWFEIRLFYVRIAPCVVDSVPSHLTLRHLRREIGVSLEINGSRIPASETASLTLRRDRLDKESSEVTYVSTDSVRVTGAVEFEVYEKEDLILCGSLERMESSAWNKGSIGLDHHQVLENDPKTGWTMDCYTAASIATGSSVFFKPKLGISSPSIEVYVAGCCSGVPLILTKTIQLSPRRKPPRHGTLDAIPEDEETGKDQNVMGSLVRHRKLQEKLRKYEKCKQALLHSALTKRAYILLQNYHRYRS